MSATRQSWSNLQPLPVQRAPLSLQREFIEQEYERLCNGLIPDRMEDKWFLPAMFGWVWHWLLFLIRR